MKSPSPGEEGTLVCIVPIHRLTLALPFYHAVAAGFPSPADDYFEERLDLNRHLIRNPSATFFVRVEGHSMTGAGIYPDDILVVDRSAEARSGDVVVAVLEGEFTVKRLILGRDRALLRAENPAYPSIDVTPESDFMVWGVVISVIHTPYEL